MFEDADLDQACVGAVAGIFGAAGQMCTAGSRLLVQNSIQEAFTERLLAMARELKLGDPMRCETEIGPIATPPQYEKVLQLHRAGQVRGRALRAGRRAGHRARAEGRPVRAADDLHRRHSRMRIAQEEVFGPVLSIIGFDTEEDAVSDRQRRHLRPGGRCVDARHRPRRPHVQGPARRRGLGQHLSRLQLHGADRRDEAAPGLGRECGIEAIHEFLETKSVMISTAAAAPNSVMSAALSA